MYFYNLTVMNSGTEKKKRLAKSSSGVFSYSNTIIPNKYHDFFPFFLIALYIFRVNLKLHKTIIILYLYLSIYYIHTMNEYFDLIPAARN